MPDIIIDRQKISSHFKANVTVISDFEFVAVEVRATKTGEPYMKGCGYDLISDDRSEEYYTENGIAYTYEPVTSISFDIESSELRGDGEYRISIYLKNTDGVWNDVCGLYTNASEAIVDCNGKYIFAQRNMTGVDKSYISVFSGEETDNFVSEVLSIE